MTRRFSAIDKSNLVKILVRTHDDADVKHCITSSGLHYEGEKERPFEIVDFAYGYEGPDDGCSHEHVHIVVRTNIELKNDISVLRTVWDLDHHPHIQDIRLADDWKEAVEYAVKCGHYVWPSQRFPNEILANDNPIWFESQQRILDELAIQNDRQILCVIDPNGNSGKTTLVRWHHLRYLGVEVPIANNFKDLMRFSYDIHEKHHRPLPLIFLDIPKAFPKSHLNPLYSAVEKLKDGQIWDDRYSLEMRNDLPAPKICVMTNTRPNDEHLTADRWVFLTIRPDGSCVRSVPPQVEWQNNWDEVRRQKHREAQRRYQARKDAEKLEKEKEKKDRQKISNWNDNYII